MTSKDENLLEYIKIDYSKPKNLYKPSASLFLTKTDAEILNRYLTLNRTNLRYVPKYWYNIFNFNVCDYTHRPNLEKINARQL